MNNTYNMALKYNSIGICVIPVIQKVNDVDMSKRPSVSWKKYQSDRPEDDQLKKWFDNGTPKNLAVLGGKVSGGIVWIDFDDAEAYHEWADKYTDIARNAPTQSTGKGFHVGFRFNGDCPGNQDLYWNNKHIGETRGEGGYIIAAPSIHGSGRKYVWIRPPFDCDFPVISGLHEIGLDVRSPEKVSGIDAVNITSDNGLINGQHPKVKKTIETVLGRLMSSGQGTRNNTLHKSAYTLGGLVGGGHLDNFEAEKMLTSAALALGLSEREILATIKSGLGSGINEPIIIDDDGHQSAVSFSGSSDNPLLSELGDHEGHAQCFIHLYRGNFLFTNELGWLHFNGTHWVKTGAEQKLNRGIIDMLKKRRVLAVQADYEGLVKATKRTQANVNGTEFMLRSILWTSIDEFDADPDKLNCANGVVDFLTGEIEAHSNDQFFTYCVNDNYNPEADESMWEEWIYNSIKPSGSEDEDGRYMRMADWIQKAVGYSITGQTLEQCFFYLYGPTRSGKGIFIQSIMSVLGKPLGANIGFETLTAKREGDTQNFDLAPLKPARFLGASENNITNQFNEALIKRITGEDPINCSFKHKTPFEYTPMFKIWLSCNHAIKARAADDAFWARVRVINFPNSHLGREDKTLKRRLLDNSEGILKWAIDGAISWRNSIKNGDHRALEMPITIKTATAAQRDENDTIQQFMNECCVIGKKFKVKGTAFTSAYKEWCKENSYSDLGGRNIKIAMDAKGFPYKTVRGDAGPTFKGYAGIGLEAVS